MKLEAMFECPLLEVPDNDIGLEAHESALTAGYVLAVRRHPDNRDLVVVAA